MKPFLQHLRESPWETDAPVPVSVYLPLAPQLERPDRVQMLLQAFRDKRISADEQSLATFSLVPTQAVVNQNKVMSYMQQDLASDRPPLILLDSGAYVIIDGHHRICGAAVTGQKLLTCLVLNSAQAYELDHSIR